MALYVQGKYYSFLSATTRPSSNHGVINTNVKLSSPGHESMTSRLVVTK